LPTDRLGWKRLKVTNTLAYYGTAVSLRVETHTGLSYKLCLEILNLGMSGYILAIPAAIRLV
jgi:hypothetical protein